MKLITSAQALEREFNRLISDYAKFNWATAWASTGAAVFDEVVSNSKKIEKIIVGIHFYQTHPDFIKEFLNNRRVRFIMQPAGTFHPKLYLFSNNAHEWELIVGSANFTKEAFANNSEACILISHQDKNADATYRSAIKLIEQAWANGKYFTPDELDKYRTTWEIHRQKIKSLSGHYSGSSAKAKPIHEVEIANLNWQEFYSEVKNNDTHGIEKRLKVLQTANELFQSQEHFKDLEPEKRKFIAGMPNQLFLMSEVDWGFFGSMKGAGKFKKEIINNNKNISNALDEIPLSGQVTQHHYNKFVKHFTNTFPNTYVATATRLLAMKRPDTFVCIDKMNFSGLAKDFGIIQSGMNLQRYWDDVIMRIQDCNWWCNPEPASEQEKRVSNARAAFLDSIYYRKLTS